MAVSRRAVISVGAGALLAPLAVPAAQASQQSSAQAQQIASYRQASRSMVAQYGTAYDQRGIQRNSSIAVGCPLGRG